MSIRSLTAEEREVVRRAMEATFTFLGEGEYSVRMGVERAEMRALLDVFPDLGDESPSSSARLAVNNALNDLLHGVGISEAECLAALGVSRAETLRIYRSWVRSVRWRSTGLR